MMWNFDAETMDAMMKDVGVSLLKSDDLINGRSSAWSSSQSAVDSVQSNVRESVFCVSLVNGSRFINVAVEYFLSVSYDIIVLTVVSLLVLYTAESVVELKPVTIWFLFINI